MAPQNLVEFTLAIRNAATAADGNRYAQVEPKEPMQGGPDEIRAIKLPDTRHNTNRPTLAFQKRFNSNRPSFFKRNEKPTTAAAVPHNTNADKTADKNKPAQASANKANYTPKTGTYKCFNCGQHGHISSQCKLPRDPRKIRAAFNQRDRTTLLVDIANEDDYQDSFIEQYETLLAEQDGWSYVNEETPESPQESGDEYEDAALN
jgi:hypothetical protein